jgi:hypothetical protein
MASLPHGISPCLLPLDVAAQGDGQQLLWLISLTDNELIIGLSPWVSFPSASHTPGGAAPVVDMRPANMRLVLHRNLSTSDAFPASIFQAAR